jgi:hypothetical protein
VVALLFFFAADRFSPPPDNMHAVAVSGLIFILVLLLWPWWFDRHREAVSLANSAGAPS